MNSTLNFLLSALAITLLWEHNALFTPGFVVERTEDLITWQQVGYVPAEHKFATNQNDFTYRWQSENEPLGFAFYRVGSVIENQSQ